MAGSTFEGLVKNPDKFAEPDGHSRTPKSRAFLFVAPQIWNVRGAWGSRPDLYVLKGHANGEEISGLCFAADGNMVLSRSTDGTLKVRRKERIAQRRPPSRGSALTGSPRKARAGRLAMAWNYDSEVHESPVRGR